MKTKRFLLPLLLAVVIVGVSAFAGFVLANGSEEKPPEPQREAASVLDRTVGAPDSSADLSFDAELKQTGNLWERSDIASGILENGALAKRGDDYPDYFGGSYFDDEEDILYVYLTDMGKRSMLEKELGDYKDSVVFLKGEISFNELNAISHKVADELLDAGFTVALSSTFVMDQSAVIAVLEKEYDAAIKHLESLKLTDNKFLQIGFMESTTCAADTTSSDDAIGPVV